jgi:leader peptidase (prepilin peptidase)/N-methyltransferase
LRFQAIQLRPRGALQPARRSDRLRHVYSIFSMIREQIRIWGTVFAALLGLAFGSFLNVCLSRWPEGESIVTPRSHCRSCGRVLQWWENVPLVSWVALRGRCRGCGVWIGWRYVLIELTIGVLWAHLAWQYLTQPWDADSPALEILFGLFIVVGKAIFFWLLIALAALDAENLWLPNRLTLPGIALGIGYKIFILALIAHGNATVAFENERYGLYGAAGKWLLGILAAAGLILLIRWVYWLIRHREGIALGDAKLMALLAAWLGLPGALLAFAIGIVVGAAIALVVIILPRAPDGESPALLKLPLGTFLCLGGIVSGLWGPRIIAAYMQWARF